MKLFFVFNPKAGQETIKKRLGDIIELFSVKGHQIAVAATTKRGDACAWVKNLPTDSYDRIICAGGDGTLDEVVQGMMEGNIDLPLGYIPAGSTNDFARSLGLPVRIMDAAEVAVSDRLAKCDVGDFNGHSFVYVAAFGAFTEVSYKTPQDVKNVFGHAAYILEGMKYLSEIKSFHMKVTTDHMTIEDDFIYGMVTNSDSLGGFKNITGSNIVMDDGLFEVTLVRRPDTAIEYNAIIAGLLNRDFATKDLYYFKTDKITFQAGKNIPWTLDGEFGGNVRSAKIENRKQRLTIAIKKEK